MSNDDRDDSAHNPFADQLSEIDVDVSESPGEKQQSDDGDSPAESPASKESPASEDEQLDDEELFRRAVDDLDARDVYRGKFGGDAPSGESSSPSDEPSEQSAPDRGPRKSSEPEESSPAADVEMFQRAVADVDPLEDRDKYHRPEPNPRRKSRPDAEKTETADDAEPDFVTPLLPKQGEGLNWVPKPEKAQRELLQRYRHWKKTTDGAPSLNLRQKTRRKALQEIGNFVAEQFDDDIRFVRIVTGRGVRSDGEPVIKPTVLHWLEGAGAEYVRGYIPERIHTGDYGSLLVELDIS